VRNHAAYLAGDERWMLGRFVVPATRLGELAEAVARETPNGTSPNGTAPNGTAPNGMASWRVSVLAASPLDATWAADVAHIAAFRAACAARVDALELRASAPDAMALARRAADAVAVAPSATFVEVPWSADHAAMAEAARAHGVALKLRTGGVTADAFPGADVVARFAAACVARGVPFKLTAGLHHALRGEHPLTYEPGCARGTMHGFLNVLAVAALLAAGHDVPAVAPLLAERDASAMVVRDDALQWRGLTAGLTDLEAGRRALVSFGSCSFAEPVHELRALGLLPATSRAGA